MKPPYLSTLTAAHRAIELVNTELAVYKSPVMFFEVTDLGGLPSERSVEETSPRQMTEFANRLRAAKYLSLSSASEAIRACMTLIQTDLELFEVASNKLLNAIASDLLRSSEAMRDASDILNGMKVPDVDHSINVSKLVPPFGEV